VYQTQSDAYGQVITQQAAGGTATYAYDGLGRAVKAGFRYSGLGNTLAQDPNATYTRGPGGELLGVGAGAGAGSRYAWLDQHLDVVAQYTATGTTLAGSATYDPLGKVTATTGMVGNLGYQSEWTEALTGRVNMHARWYNSDTGQFDTRDSMSVAPVPDSIRANRFQYGDGNPLTTVDPTGHFGWNSIKKGFSNVTKAVNTAVNYASTAYTYVASGQAWNDVKAGAAWVADKATKAWNVVADTTTKWAKDKYNKVKDAVSNAKQCLAGGAKKCVTETAKNAAKKAVNSVKNTVEAIKKDPWKFVATAAAGIAAAAAVAALCATGIGCLIIAGAVAGAMSAGAGYMVDVGRGDKQFSWSGLASTMIEGGLDGALSAGMSRFTGGVTRFAGSAARAGGSGLAGGAARAFTAGPGRSSGPARPSSGPASSPARPSQPSAGQPGGGSNYQPRHRAADSGDRETSTADQYEGRHRACEGHSFDPATLVLLADGSTKPIGEIEVGDEVVATDPESDEQSAKPVTQLHVNVDEELTDLTVRDAVSGEVSVLKTTQNHPFWDATDGRWVAAGELTPGHRLLVHDDKRLEGDGTGAGVGGGGPGAEVVVVEVENFVGSKTMRDLTVADLHTYYVVAGAQPVLVHNNNYGFEENHCPAVGRARALADQSTGFSPSRLRPLMAEAIQLSDGNVIARTSVRGLVVPRVFPQVQAILDPIPVPERGRGHGRCGLIQCLSAGLYARLDVRGASAAAFTVASRVDHPNHGMPAGPCPSCRVVSDVYDLQWETF
jgi:RHS repeat-associated protein